MHQFQFCAKKCTPCKQTCTYVCKSIQNYIDFDVPCTGQLFFVYYNAADDTQPVKRLHQLHHSIKAANVEYSPLSNFQIILRRICFKLNFALMICSWVVSF